jgi:hypothetical protein
MPSDKLPTRYDVEWAIEKSRLPTVARDVLFLLARRMDQGTTLIPGHRTPSLSKIAEASGWSRRHVLRGLNFLEAAKLITRTRPAPYDARVRHVRTRYTVHLDQLAGLETGSPAEARDSWSYGVGTPRRGAKATQAQGLGTAGPEARDSVAHTQNLPENPEPADTEITFIRGYVSERTGQTISEDQAAGIRAVILARPGAQGQRPMAYIRRVLTLDTRQNPEKWLEPSPEEK